MKVTKVVVTNGGGRTSARFSSSRAYARVSDSGEMAPMGMKC
jgi:hypothetical protein